MAEEEDIWTLLDSYLASNNETFQSKQESILSYTKGIPDIQIDPLTVGLSQPTLLLGEQGVEGIIPCSSVLQSQKLIKFKEIREQLINEIDEFEQIQKLDNIESHHLQSTLKPKTYDFNQLIPLINQEISPGIETVLYTNHDMFDGTIQSVSSAYLHSDLKQYSTTNVISKGQLIKDKHGPQQVELGDRLIQLEEIEDRMEQKGKQFAKESNRIKQDRELLQMQRIQDFNERIVHIEDKYIKDQVASVAAQLPLGVDKEFYELWYKLIEEEQQQETKLEQQEIVKQAKKQSEELILNEDSVISQSDYELISQLSDLQKQAYETAKNNNIEDQQQEEEQNENIIINQVNDAEEPVFLDSMQFAANVDVEIQEQDPKIRAQIEEALAVKTKFRIIKLIDIQNDKKVNKFSKNYKFAYEDESDVSNFYDQLPKAKMAKQFQFELDDFQKRSILHLERKESVFVCAHTSAGKTVIAEYAIALAFKHNRRALYTSPIKALSNQKYREFDTKFGNTGVVTGDVSINPGSPCLILTTEILRNMLYRGAELIRDVEWVIFDEVHYVNDQERGMVWEETIIMLPPHIGIIMLSATVPNYMDFANWVGRTRKEKVYVMKTFTRPVPLEHHLFLFDKFHMIKEKESDFLDTQYTALKNQIKKVQDEKKGLRERIKKNMDEKKDDELYKNTNKSMRQKFSEKQMKAKFIQNVSSASMRIKDEKRGISQLIKLCDKKDLLPCVIFVFSRRKINELANGMIQQKGGKLIDSRTEGKIITFYDHALQKLKPQDRKSPQLLRLRELLRYGIAIHHGHLLPIAKEIVEILFSEGLIKVLFATETFAMGINMPTKTVIFHSVEKFDGFNGLRMLTSSEYTQMSGRAGRRGIDEKGNVILYIKDANSLPEQMSIKKMVDSKGLELQSKFKITYSIILNLLTSKDMDATEMMKRSYHENYRYVALPDLMQALQRIKKEYINESIIQCPYQKGIRSGVAKSLIQEYTEIIQTFRVQQQSFFQKLFQDRSKNHMINFPRYGLFSDEDGNISICIIIRMEQLSQEIHKLTLLSSSVPDIYNQYKFTILTVHTINEDEKQKYRYRKIKLTYEDSKDKEQGKKYKLQQLKKYSQFIYQINEITEENLLDLLEDQIKTNLKQSFQNEDIIYEDLASQLVEKQQYYDSMKDLLQAIYQPQQQQLNMNKKKIQTLQRYKYKFKQKQQKLEQEEDEENIINEFIYRDQQIQEVLSHQCQHCDLKEKHIQQLIRKDDLKKAMNELKKKIDGNDQQNQNEFENKLSVLKLLGYVDVSGLPLIKARIARELMDQNTIYICEVLVDNIMETLKPPEIAALMTAFVCQDRRRDENDINEQNIEFYIHDKFDEISFELTGALISTYQLIYKILEQEAFLQVLDNPDVVESIKGVLNFNLTQVIFLWAKGQSFVDVCLQTDIEEGSIVRTIQRLENMLRGVSNAFKVMGNLKMVEKVDIACSLIKKDIVFAESLYFDQNARVNDKYLPVKDASTIVPIINSLRNKFYHIFLTKDYHPNNHVSFYTSHENGKPYTTIIINGQEQELWPPHCIQDQDGSKIHKDLIVKETDQIIYKGTKVDVDSYSGFGNENEDTHLLTKLNELKIKETYVLGLALDVCVMNTAIDAFKNQFITYIIEDASKAINPNEAIQIIQNKVDQVCQENKELSKTNFKIIKSNEL